MKEFMLLIRNAIDHEAEWSPEQNREFLKKCEVYIDKLKQERRLISAQPLVREGKLISGTNNAWQIAPLNETKEVIHGYYHILAGNLDEAISIAKANPEFEYSTTARIEVRPIKTKEPDTGYIYPKKAE